MIDSGIESRGLILEVLSMNRSTYRNQLHVRSFIAWAAPIVRGERPLSHRWHSAKFGGWSCKSIFDAYCCFDWRYSVRLPGDSHKISGCSFDENANVLSRLQHILRDSAATGDTDSFLEAAIAVVQWGGVYRNTGRLRDLGQGALSQFCVASKQLDPTSADTEDLSEVQDMNSGFSKIYSLLVDGLPIYDSRVACALASLVRSYCQERGLRKVPPELAVGIPSNRAIASRDPSVGSIQFPKLRWGEKRKYAVSNLKAAWLLEPLAAEGRFGELPSGLLALQSALFMIGYKVPEQGYLGRRFR